MSRHDHLAAALDRLLEQLEQGDAVAAEAASQRALELFATTPAANDDPRLRPAYDRCRTAIDTLYARLNRELKESAVSSRAGKAYADRGPEE